MQGWCEHGISCCWAVEAVALPSSLRLQAYLCAPYLLAAFPALPTPLCSLPRPTQALRSLAKDKPAEDLQAALPSWAYLFGRLVMDGNRAVRAEACHVTAALATAVGRGIAPLLKSLLPPLWLAHFDAYGEAAAAARGAMAAAFATPAKRREALLFCRAEVGRAVWRQWLRTLANGSLHRANGKHPARRLHLHCARLAACVSFAPSDCTIACAPLLATRRPGAMRNHRFIAQGL